MTKFLKYTKWAMAILLGIFLLLYIVVFSYVSVNKKSIIAQVTREVGKKINGNVSVGSIELSFFRTFPKVSVLLHDVAVTDTMYVQHHHPFFKGEEVYALLSIMKLIKKQSAVNGLRIQNATIYLYTDTSGYSNEYLFKSKKNTTAVKDTSYKKNELQSIEFKNLKVIIDDRKRNKLHDVDVNKMVVKINDEALVTLFSVKTNMLVHNLAFNKLNGSFLTGKTFEGNFDLLYKKNIKQLQFDKIQVKLSGQPFNLSGRFDLAGMQPQFKLQVHARKLNYEVAKSLLTEKIAHSLSMVSLDKNIDADADISGPLKGGEPLINVGWKVVNAHLITPFLDFDDAGFGGFYTNEVVAGLPRRDPNSKLVINNFSASWNKLPVSSGNIEILNLFQPVLTCDLQSKFPLTTLNEIISTNSLQLLSGEGSINMTYKGPIERNNNTNSFINGVVSFNQGTVMYVPRNVEMKNVNGLLKFENSNVHIENLQCDVLNNKVVMNGQANNLLTLINSAPNKVNIDWNIYSPSLNLSAFTFLLKSRNKLQPNKSAKSKLSKMANGIDDVLEQGSLSVNLKAARLMYKKFVASNAIANVTLLQDRYIINQVSMNHAGGSVNLSGSLVNVKQNYHQAKLNVTMNNVDVKDVFSAFSNFGQDGITAGNLEGKLTAKVNADVALDNDGKPYSNSIESIVDFSLKNGALNNFEPIKKLQSFVFKKRDFENIHFAELKDRLEISKQQIKINRMEIQSSVMSMFVEGIYGLKGNTDMSIQVPLSNLKKRDADYSPENIGTDKKGGRSIFIRGRPGADGNIQFKLDLFNKFRKEKEKVSGENQP